MRPRTMSIEIRCAILTLVASFAATFAFLWWHREPVLVFVDSPQSVEPQQPPPAAPVRPSMPPPKPAPADNDVKKVLVKDKPADHGPSANLDGPPLPLLVSVGAEQPEYSLENHEGDMLDIKTPNRVEILNTSDQLLAVTVIDVNMPTQKTSSTQVMLPPNGHARIGAEASLAMESGDAITLRSSGFRDMSQTVP
jgi:hypothetical protein